MAIGLLILFSHKIHSADKDLSELAFFIFYFGYCIFYISLPPFVYSFLLRSLTSSDLIPLLRECFHSSHLHQQEGPTTSRLSFLTKASLISRFNYLSSLSVCVAYSLNQPPDLGQNSWITIFFCFLYILPVTSMFIVACCVLEMFRMQQRHYFNEILLLRETLHRSRYPATAEGMMMCLSSDSLTTLAISTSGEGVTEPMVQERRGMGMLSMSRSCEQQPLQLRLLEEGGCVSAVPPLPSPLPSPLPALSSSSHEDGLPSPLTIKRTLASLLDRYNSLQVYSHFLSVQYGHIFFICLANALLLVTSALWSLYVKEFSAEASLGFVVIGLVFFLEVAYLIVEINEKSLLICRELSNCILTIQSFQTLSPNEGPPASLTTAAVSPTTVAPEVSRPLAAGQMLDLHLTAEELQRLNLFLSCMAHSKIQIFFFGNFLLRFRTLFGVVGSVIAAFIPGIVY
jgi:hypothetical protein